MDHKNQITIVIISHRSKEHVLRFLSGLRNKYNVLIIDNSNDKKQKKSVENKINIKFYTTRTKDTEQQ